MSSTTSPNTNPEAEVSVLGACLIDADAITAVVDQLAPVDFYVDAHRLIWGAIKALASAQEPANLVSVANYMRRAEAPDGRGSALDAAGGPVYLAELANSVHTTANVEQHARILKTQAQARRLGLMLAEAQANIRAGKAPERIAADIEAALQSTDIAAKSGALVSVDEFLARPKSPWLVQGFLPEASTAILYGESTSGKSFLAIRLALSVAMGYHFNGLPNPSDPGLVIYVLAEGGGGFGSRLAAWITHTGERIDNLLLWDGPVDLTDTAAVMAFIGHCRRQAAQLGLPVKLIVLDTLAKCMPGVDENSAQETGRALSSIDQIQRATGATVLALHHTQKANAEKYRGSSAIFAGVDTALLLTLDRESGERTLACDKMKDQVEFQPTEFALIPVLSSAVMVPVSEASPETVVRPVRKPERLTVDQADLLDVYFNAPQAGIDKRDAAKLAEIDIATVRSQTNRFVQTGVIRVVPGSFPKRYFAVVNSAGAKRPGFGDAIRAASDARQISSDATANRHGQLSLTDDAARSASPLHHAASPVNSSDAIALHHPASLETASGPNASNHADNGDCITQLHHAASLASPAPPAGLPAEPLPLKGEAPGNPEARPSGGPPMDGLLDAPRSEKFTPLPSVTPTKPDFQEDL